MTGLTARRWSALRGGCAIVLALAAQPSVVQAKPTPAVFGFRIAAGPLHRALITFASVTGEQLLYSTELVAGRQAARLDGRLSADQALDRLLEGTGLVAQRVGPRMIVLRPRVASGRAVGDTGSGAGAGTASATGAVAIAPRDQNPPAILDSGSGDEPAQDDIIVTGTHLRGGAAGSPPVDRLTRDDLDRRGFATVAQALQALPGNFGGMANEQSALAFADTSGSNGGFATGVNLRGLGAGATLVLVNGQRLGGSGTKGAFADITSIPTGALDRVEVLMDGASAIYGSDAVGGVVNILLKRHFKGAETRVRFGSVTSGGKRDVQIDQTLGKQWSTGGVMLSYEYDQSGRLASADRAFARSSDSRSLGGTDHRYVYSLPGNVLGIDPVTGALGVAYAIPSGQDGTALTPGDFLAGKTNLQNSRIDTDLIPRQVRHSVYATLDQDVGAGLHVTADARYAHRAFDARLAGSAAIVQVTAANPYFVSPTGASSDLIAYSLAPELGPIDTHGYAEALATSLGLDADLGAGWKLRSYAAFAQEREFNESRNLVNTAALAEASGSIPDTPATPFSTAKDGFFDPYGTGHANSAAILDFVGEGYSRSRTRSQVLTGHVDADGSLFSVPGGTVRLAVGGDVRRETFRRSGESLLSSALPVATANVAASRLIEAGFVEAQVPIVGSGNAMPLIRRLDVSLAARVEHSDDFGTTTNPKVGVAWAPLAGVTLRSSFGTSFRAPNLRELRDPEQYSVTTLVRGGASVPVIQLSGGNPGLKPEKAQSWTAGFDLDPAAVRGLHLNATWFSTVFKQRVATPASANFANALSDPSLAPFVQRVAPNSNAADLARVSALLGDALKKALTERALNAEMDHHLAGEDGSGNTRNGYGRKTVMTDTGKMAIDVPRDRQSSFDPQLIAKYQRRFPGFDEKIVSMYARGMSTREITGHLHDLYGIDVSPDLISTVTDAVLDEVVTWQQRPLDAVYPLVFFDAIRVKIRDEGMVRNKAIHIALGVRADGAKEVLGLWLEQNEGAKFWLRVMNELRNRGVEDVLLAVVDGLKGFPEAITAVFPETIVQTCIVHLLRNSMDFVSWKDRKNLASALKEVYRATSAEAAEKALTAFEAGPWGQRYPAIGQSWRRAWSEVIPFFAFPDEVRRIVYTTDEIDKTSGAKMCYGSSARATPWRRAEHRMRVLPGRLITALPTWSVRAPLAAFPTAPRSARMPARRAGRHSLPDLAAP